MTPMECIPATTTPVLVLLLILFIPVNLYPFFYAFRPWRAAAATRALMVKGMANLILIDMGLATALFGDYIGRDTIRLVGLGVLAVGIWYLFLALMLAPGARNYPPRSWRRHRR